MILIPGLLLLIVLAGAARLALRRLGKSENRKVQMFLERCAPSNRFLWLLSGILLVPVGYWVYIHRNLIPGGSREEGIIFVIGLVVISAPFAAIFGTLAARGLSTGLFNMIYGGGERPEPEKHYVGNTLVVQNKFDEAIAEFRRLLDENPADDYAQEHIAEIYALNLREHRKAVEEYRKLAQMDVPGNRVANALNRIADICSDHLDDPLTAAEALREIIRRFPGTPNAQRAKIRLDSMNAQLGSGPQ
jgi:tetratricopeptide (TPR) repeat protein